MCFDVVDQLVCKVVWQRLRLNGELNCSGVEQSQGMECSWLIRLLSTGNVACAVCASRDGGLEREREKERERERGVAV